MLRHCGTVAQELSLTQNYYRGRGGVTESALVAGPRPGLAAAECQRAFEAEYRVRDPGRAVNRDSACLSDSCYGAPLNFGVTVTQAAVTVTCDSLIGPEAALRLLQLQRSAACQ